MESKKEAGKLKYEVDYINSCSELELFIQVNTYYGLLEKVKLIPYYKRMYSLYQQLGEPTLANHFKMLEEKLINELPTVSNLEELENTANFCIAATNRFHTNTIKEDGKVEVTPEFKNWYYKWDQYTNNMDNATLQAYRRCRYESKGLEHFQLDQPFVIEEVDKDLEKINQKTYHYTNKNIRHNIA